ncbi:MAG TPA: hypothetical protein VIF57_24855 [Polyangia bacterium]
MTAHEHSTWKIGGGAVPRTGETELTDDELILCDTIFKARTVLRLLMVEGDDFNEMFNLGYRPSVGGADRLALIESMSRRGLIERSGDADRSGAAVSLTPDGGQLWERERRPVWEAQVRSTSRSDTSLTIRARRKEVADAFVKGINEARMVETRGAPEVAFEDDARLVSWRRSRTVVMTFRDFRDLPGVDWVTYESQRIWWQSVPQLLTSHGALDPLPGLPAPPPLFRVPAVGTGA